MTTSKAKELKTIEALCVTGKRLKEFDPSAQIKGGNGHHRFVVLTADVPPLLIPPIELLMLIRLIVARRNGGDGGDGWTDPYPEAIEYHNDSLTRTKYLCLLRNTFRDAGINPRIIQTESAVVRNYRGPRSRGFYRIALDPTKLTVDWARVASIDNRFKEAARGMLT